MNSAPAAIDRVGYIGLGDIGAGMALNLTKRSGKQVMVYDLRAEALEPAVQAGAAAATSLDDVVAFADLIHLCLVYDEQIADMILGEGGILAKSRPGQVIVVHSTVFPATVQRCAAAAAERGVAVLDAPVTGEGRAAAAAGELNLLVGGDVDVVERCRPILETMGTVHHLGDVGAGEAMKLTNNVMFHGNRLIYLEALKIAAAYGIDEVTVDQIVAKGTGASYAQAHHARPDAHGQKHTLAGSEELPIRFSKDLRYASQIGLDKLLTIPITALAAQVAPRAYAGRWEEVRKRSEGA